MTSYLREPVDELPFGSEAKARRYATERYAGAVGRNWYRCDPTLQQLMRRYLGADGLAWAEPHLDELGALMGGPIAARAEETDRHPPRLEKYDRWGRDVSEVVMPATFEASRRDLIEHNFGSPAFREEARRAGVDAAPLSAAWAYLLDQAEIGMMCALGTGGDMVVRLADEFAPDDVKQRVRELFAAGEFAGEAAQMLTERTGGSDLAALETTATPVDDAWSLSGLKWFASNANGSAFVVLAKPVGAPDTIRGIAPFLVLRERRDGTRNGVRIRRLKDKLGTRAVASAEVEFDDAEAFLLVASSRRRGDAVAAVADGRGMARMMELTNGARLGIAMMGLGCARRALVESLCYARAREAFGHELVHHPLMQRKLAELIVEVEAAEALVFDGYLGPRLRIGAPLIKLRAARLGITAASDAIEIHGGNGYIEQWPVARLLRDAQVNTVWEGPDNILCLDVRRAMERDGAEQPFLDRLRAAVDRAPSADHATLALVRARIDDLANTIETWRALDRTTGEARLYALAQFMADVYAAALLLEHAGWEEAELGTDRTALVARLYARHHLADLGPRRGIDDPAEELTRFKDLVDGAFSSSSSSA
ncbi:MAG: acyl-CoA dehydrogenase family protein [Ilumatobacteraceae bacterium]